MRNTLLVIEPAPAVLRFLRTYLADEPIDLVEAADAESALRILEGRRVDLVLTAFRLPDMTGFDICERIRANPCTSSIPTILLGETISRAEKVRGLQLGVSDYVSVPIDPTELQVRVRSALKARAMQRELEQQNSLLYQLHEFSLKLNSRETIDETLRTTLICALSLTYSGRACIMTPIDGGKRLRGTHFEGKNTDAVESITVRLGEGVSGRVFRNKGMCVVNDPGQIPDGSGPELAFFGRPPFVSLAIPAEAGPVGVLNVADKRTGQVYSEPDIRILRCVATTAAVAIDSQRRRLRLDRTQDAALLGLAGLAEWRDPETGRHLERLREYSRLLAIGLQMTPKYAGVIDQKFIDALVRSVPMHDIGKVGIPDNVLLKPDNLTGAEYAVIKRHTEMGAAVLQSMADRIGRDTFLDMARDIAHYHHEKYDGTGYPVGLAGENIPLPARITAVADVYDALASDRVYRKAWSHDKTIEFIRTRSGTHFDPDVADALVRQTNEFLRLKTQMTAPEPHQDQPAEVPAGAFA